MSFFITKSRDLHPSRVSYTYWITIDEILSINAAENKTNPALTCHLTLSYTSLVEKQILTFFTIIGEVLHGLGS